MYMRSSTVPATMNLVTLTMLSCPKRCILSTACSSLPLFHHGSTMIPRQAMVRFSPWQQHFVLIRNTLILGFFLNLSTLLARASRPSFPSMRRNLIFSKALVLVSMSKKRGNMQKTRILYEASSANMLLISSTTARALDDGPGNSSSSSSFWASSSSIIFASTSSRLSSISSCFPSSPSSSPSSSPPPAACDCDCGCDCDMTSPYAADALRAILPLQLSFAPFSFAPSSLAPFPPSLLAPPSSLATPSSLSELSPSTTPPSSSLS
mmetsp:Transcript_14266/g.35800  ORF Transcript_14266/g.35800 Transcript_14266/m.35800 type:complete len:265 (+) Transcript_14266:507-1301(+)